MRHRPAAQAGFSLIEMLIAVTIIVVATSTAIAVTTSILPGIRADSQGRRVIALMQYGRDLAISNRRNVEIRFDDDLNTTTLVLMDAGVEKPVQTLYFEYEAEFRQMPSLGDTPEGYGAAGTIDFGDSTRIIFEPEGSVIDETGLPVNGTVFLGIHDQLQAARAITLTGTTGRARMYRWSRADSPYGGWWSPQ